MATSVGAAPEGSGDLCARMSAVARMVIVGGGPGGYEAALVAAQVGAEVTLVDRDGLGGSAVLTDVVPSKALITVADVMDEVNDSRALGVRFDGEVGVDLAVVNERLQGAGDGAVRRRRGAPAGGRRPGRCAASGRLDGPDRVVADARGRWRGDAGGRRDPGRHRCAPARARHRAARRRADPVAGPSSTTSTELPERADRGRARVSPALSSPAPTRRWASQVTLVSSRDRVLPGEDADAAAVLEEVFERRGMTVLSRSRAVAVDAHGGRRARSSCRTAEPSTGSHVLMAVGSVPNTDGLGLDGGRGRASTTAASSRSTGCRGRAPAGSTPPVTAPAC